MAYKRVLVFMKSYLGDAVMAQPTIDSVSRASQETHVLTSSSVGELLGDYFPVARRLESAKRRSLAITFRQAKSLRELDFEVAVLVNNSFRSALICRLARIPKRVGHSKERRDFLLTDAVKFDAREFQADTVARLLKPLGIAEPVDHPRLRVRPEDSTNGASLLGGATIGFQPGARDPWKRIPFEKSLSVAKAVTTQGHRLALIGGPEERDQADALVSELGDRAVNLAGSTSIRETLGCLSALKACYGGDTGLMHLAVAAGTPTVQVFGSDRASKWGHAYAPHRVIEAPEHDLTKLDDKQLAEAVLGAAALK